MASMLHEGLVLLFRNRPMLAPELLQEALGVKLPAWSEARVEPAELTEVAPTEYRADLVVLLLDGKPVFAIVVEVQLSRSARKRHSWPVYLTHLRSRLKCPTALLVVAPDAAVARWCARPIELGHPGFTLQPLVLGPEAIPVLTDKRAARREPELAVLSAMAHGRREVGQAIARSVLSAVEGLDEERAKLYFDLALSSLSEAARHALEALMQSGTYEYQSEFARKYFSQGRQEGLEQGLQKGLQKGRKEGREEGREEGRQEGIQKGLQKGRQEGLQQGERAALLEVLNARGLKVDAASRQQILACTELAQLKRWLRKAVTVGSVQELFERGPAPKPVARKIGKPGRGMKAPSARPKR